MPYLLYSSCLILYDSGYIGGDNRSGSEKNIRSPSKTLLQKGAASSIDVLNDCSELHSFVLKKSITLSDLRYIRSPKESAYNRNQEKVLLKVGTTSLPAIACRLRFVKPTSSYSIAYK